MRAAALLFPLCVGPLCVGLLCVGLLCVGLLSCGPAPEPQSFSLLSANVGNTLLECEGYAYKLCRVDVEERVRANIAALAPDVVVLQEVVGTLQCSALDEDDPAHTCHEGHVAGQPSQALRLVGDDYRVVCDARAGFDCVAVKRSFGTFTSCDAEGRCGEAVTAPVVPGCDPGFTVSATDVVIAGEVSIRVVNGHPQSGFDTACRAAQLEQMFGELAGPGPTVIAGDMNLDPWVDNDESVVVWDEHVGDGQRFGYHSGPAEQEPPYPTSVNPLASGVLDHVVSDFLEGSCTTLGEAPGSERLDGGEGMDHRALFCELTL